ncbi:MAG: hypothetical protein OEW08_13510 [Gammaproteobacteria bacterium]|nr:hypothetical protein [Gammaproteobacteria bacterium]
MIVTRRTKANHALEQRAPTDIFPARPGHRERQLQRRLNNPLFGAVGQVTPQALQAAQHQGQMAMWKFIVKFRN